MKENFSKSLRSALALLFSIPEFENFYKESLIENKIKNGDDFKKLIDQFKRYLSNNRIILDEENMIFKHLYEQSENAVYENSNFKIATINKIKIPNEHYLKQFNDDFKAISADEPFFEEINKGKYKTKSEYIVCFGVDGKGLGRLIEKYKDYNHPYIYNRISESPIHAKNYSLGIPILKKALKYSLRYPNYFWNSLQTIDACASSIYQLQFLLGREGIRELNEEIKSFEIKLFKLIFLYLSRVIYMERNNIFSIDAYSNRGRIVRDYNFQYMAIFGSGVNPDIQYISDKYLAYTTANYNNLVGQPFTQYMWDSMKMYRHGSHIPNNSGGYQDIEDNTWMELVQKGHFRSLNLAERILNEFENYQLNFTNNEIDFICDHALSRNKDDFENYIKQIRK